MDSTNNRLFRFSKPEWLNNAAVRNAGVSVAGALFAVGFFFMIDAASFSHSARNGSDVHVMFVDWIPFIFSSIGMLVINSIEKSRLQADSFSYSGSGVAWKARFVLFLGFSMLAGGLAGSVCLLSCIVFCSPDLFPASDHVNHIVWMHPFHSLFSILLVNLASRFKYTSSPFFKLFIAGVVATAALTNVTVMVLKYLIKDYPIQTLYFGIANVIANALTMLSTVVLWVSQNIEDDYTYNLAL
ncbi:hypothetical protein N7474_003341 [Penicillium riverlandense]|uniref:uncharacterized protein n=1 Tax=Penicillium riverlandense TaxID=1903569 RepID=UPI002547513D|nr:uncharacterized protein N7474_003341 [Penicillium riverlandense]KAJ5826203.1 hypothetical protein N7474_003341 [Penicillium riverlandense]